MGKRIARMIVPRFRSLSDFILAKRWYKRAVYMPGPERDDLAERMRRHHIRTHKFYIRLPHTYIRTDPVSLR